LLGSKTLAQASINALGVSTSLVICMTRISIRTHTSLITEQSKIECQGSSILAPHLRHSAEKIICQWNNRDFARKALAHHVCQNFFAFDITLELQIIGYIFFKITKITKELNKWADLTVKIPLCEKHQTWQFGGSLELKGMEDINSLSQELRSVSITSNRHATNSSSMNSLIAWISQSIGFGVLVYFPFPSISQASDHMLISHLLPTRHARPSLSKLFKAQVPCHEYLGHVQETSTQIPF